MEPVPVPENALVIDPKGFIADVENMLDVLSKQSPKWVVTEIEEAPEQPEA